MKKTDLITKIAALCIFLALAAYLGIYFFRAVKAPVITAPAVQTTVRTETQISGIVVRDETVLYSQAQYRSLAVTEGKRVGKGSAVAVTYTSEESARRAESIRELELEIRQTEGLLSGLVSAEELTARSDALEKASSGLATAVARHAIQEAEESSLSLRSLLFTPDAENATAGDLLILRAELEKLQESAKGDTEPIPAPASGIFTTQLDGYETLRPDELKSLTASSLQEMIDGRQEQTESAFGKIVSSNSWYFAAQIDSDDYAQRADSLHRGARVTLEMGRYYNEPLTARIEDVGREKDGCRVLVFSCDRAVMETLSMRVVSATLVTEEHSGIRVPKEAVHTETNEEGETLHYLYVLTGVQAEKKYIEIVWETESFYLAAPGPIGSMLRSGNEIIVSAKELYDGKIME